MYGRIEQEVPAQGLRLRVRRRLKDDARWPPAWRRAFLRTGHTRMLALPTSCRELQVFRIKTTFCQRLNLRPQRTDQRVLLVVRQLAEIRRRGYPWDPARRYALAPVLRNGPAQMMQAGCAALGVRCTDAPAAVLSQDRAERKACSNCGYCHQGCRSGAKTSMDVTYLPAAVADGAEIRPECRVHGLERDTAGRITGVVYRSGGVDRRQRCNAVFLCAGAVETPRLLLHLGMANSSGQVGRNYMAHVATQVWGRFAQEMRPNKGYLSSLITEDMARPADAGFAGGYLVQSLGSVPVTWATLPRGRAACGGSRWLMPSMATTTSPASASMANACCSPATSSIWPTRPTRSACASRACISATAPTSRRWTVMPCGS